MGKINVMETGIKDLLLIEPTVFNDKRGLFLETFNEKDYRAVGIVEKLVQDNMSKSRQGVLRGLHFQVKYPQGKLVTVLSGKVFDVAVDLRKNSNTYGKWYGIVLSDDNMVQIYVPPGFAHGFLVLSEEAILTYKCSEYYHPEDEAGLIWNDPSIGIKWPIPPDFQPVLIDKDNKLGNLKEKKYEL